MNRWDREVFARTLWMECRGEDDEGRRAVAHVIWNRFARAAGKTRIAGICMADQQFSCWNAARDDSNREAMNAIDRDDDPLLEQMHSIIRDIEAGARDPIDGATLYHADWMLQPPNWALEGKAKFVKQVGHHRFFRE
jgi:spore germination cell wall hydrolase CwlJ-like protein